MQRLLTLVFLLCLAVPAGISISGCTRNPAGNYCNGEGYGLKLTDVASIDLEPRTTGISLSFGQTLPVATPKALTCKGTAAAVSSYTYGTTNNQIVDISPSGNICAGTWNRRSGGGIPDYTICNYPSPLPETNGLPYASAAITANADGVTSNQVQVYVHPLVTAVSLVLEPANNTTTNLPAGCLSQTQTAQLDAQAYYNNTLGQQALLCEPPQNATPGSNIPSCSAALGSLTYSSSNSSVGTINQNGVITAMLPGTTYITATVAGNGSSAGEFSTCPPASINVTLNGQTSGTVTQGVTQNLVTTITDTKGNQIQGLSLDYQSTNPLDISAGAAGAVTANFAGQATIYAVCQPTFCNPSPIDEVGLYQTGLSITSNPVTITTPGQASDYIWLASPKSQYFIPVELISGTLGSTVRMPYFPNSMVLDRTATNLYFGSEHELMIYTAASNSISKEDPNVPGVVLAAAPDNSKILISDPVRKVFYVYSPASGSYSSYSGVGTAAEWTPDARTLYIVGQDANGVPTLFVDNLNTNWTTYPLTSPSTNVAITVPGVGAFLSGQPTVAHAWCPSITATPPSNLVINQAYPQAASVPVQTDVLGATVDGQHIVGAGLGGGTTPTLTDIDINLFASLDNGACPATNAGINIATPFVQSPLPFQASAINQVLTSPGSDLTFFTYTPTPGATGTGTLPYYQPTTSGTLGTIGQIQLTGTPTAPLAGVFSLDNTLFFVSTAGDNLVHYINLKTLTDTQQIKPGLVDGNGNVVPATFIAVKPRTTT